MEPAGFDNLDVSACTGGLSKICTSDRRLLMGSSLGFRTGGFLWEFQTLKSAICYIGLIADR
jgi:hypothetical protein